jgi:hypothetical protein
VNLDGIGRFGIVWNNTHWYAGASRQASRTAAIFVNIFISSLFIC